MVLRIIEVGKRASILCVVATFLFLNDRKDFTKISTLKGKDISKSNIPEDAPASVVNAVHHGNNKTAPIIVPTKTIRQWGCHRRETPLIFVHIGKAGGGEIRRNLANAAENFTRLDTEWQSSGKDHHFYPIREGPSSASRKNRTEASFRRGKFCNSRYSAASQIPENNLTVPFEKNPPFEGHQPCNATTPFGIAIACPMNFQKNGSWKNQRKGYESSLCLNCDDEYYLEWKYLRGTNDRDRKTAISKAIHPPPAGQTCDIVYTAHNYIGNELHWLPPRYLKEHWWDRSPWKKEATDETVRVMQEELEAHWSSLLDDRERRTRFMLAAANGEYPTAIGKEEEDESDNNSGRWCPAGYMHSLQGGRRLYDRPVLAAEKGKDVQSYFQNCGKPIAEAADRAFQRFWNKEQQQQQSKQMIHEDVVDYSPLYASLPLHRITMLREPWSWAISRFFWHKKGKDGRCDDYNHPWDVNPTMGWLEKCSLSYLFYLCGNDCQVRYVNNQISLAQIEAQVEGNLRNAFSVVGLLEESESFYEMIDKRIDYLDMSHLKGIQDGIHKSMGDPVEKGRCKAMFTKNETFREEVRRLVPAFAVLERMYAVGVEVNRFQKEELSQCE